MFSLAAGAIVNAVTRADTAIRASGGDPSIVVSAKALSAILGQSPAYHLYSRPPALVPLTVLEGRRQNS